MTQEDKDLLLKDLCARLPYSPFVEITFDGGLTEASIDLKLDIEVINDFINGANEVKPYLRSMSSMTDKENEELFQLMGNGTDVERIDFYNKNHFDYHGLIDKGLALEAKKCMYEKPHESIKETIYDIANIVFELSKINSGGKTEPNFSMQQIFDCYDAFEESDAKGREYYKKLEEYVKENGGPECKGLMYSPKLD